MSYFYLRRLLWHESLSNNDYALRNSSMCIRGNCYSKNVLKSSKLTELINFMKPLPIRKVFPIDDTRSTKEEHLVVSHNSEIYILPDHVTFLSHSHSYPLTDENLLYSPLSSQFAIYFSFGIRWYRVCMNITYSQKMALERESFLSSPNEYSTSSLSIILLSVW